MELRRIELTDLYYANNLRNSYIDYIRQPYHHNLKQQEEWYNNTKDLYWIIEKDLDDIGIIGLTNIDMFNRKAELSLITQNYLEKEIADFALKEIEGYCFNKLSLNKIFITAFNFDKKKNDYFSERYNLDYTIKNNVL